MKPSEKENQKKPASQTPPQDESSGQASGQLPPNTAPESGDNVEQRETDAMDVTTREGKRSIKDDGF